MVVTGTLMYSIQGVRNFVLDFLKVGSHVMWYYRLCYGCWVHGINAYGCGYVHGMCAVLYVLVYGVGHRVRLFKWGLLGVSMVYLSVVCCLL